MGTVRNAISALFRARDKPTDSTSGAMEFFFGTSAAGKAANPRTAMQLSAVYACVRVLAETVAGLPLHVYRRDGSGAVRAPEHPLYRILHDQPNPEMTSFIWRETTMTHMQLWGNAYSQIIRDGLRNVIGLYPLLPERMQVDRAENGDIVYTYMKKDGSYAYLRRDEVLHIPALGFDGLIGHSPIAMQRNAIGLAIAAEEYGSKFFENGATPSGLLTHPGPLKNPERIRAAWQKAYGGSSSAGKTAVLEEDMKYQRLSMPNNEAQFLETRKFQVDEICRIFRVPPHLVGDLEHATFSNIEHQSIDFAMYSISPWLKRMEQQFDSCLLTPNDRAEYFTSFNLDGLMRGDYKSRMEGYAVARQNGWMNANDIRALENMNPIPAAEGGDAYLVNGNMIPIMAAMAKTGSSGEEEDTDANPERERIYRPQ